MEEKEEQTNKESSQPNSEPKKGEQKSSIRTYAADVASLLKGGVTMTDIALSEQKKRTSSDKEKAYLLEEQKKNRRNKVVFVIGVIFILLGIVILVWSTLRSKEDTTEEISLRTSSIIFTNNQLELDIDKLDRTAILKKINQQREGTNMPLGGVLGLYLTEGTGDTKKLVGASSFLKKINIRASDTFLRALEENYLLGIHSFDGTQGFLILKIKSFDNALAKIIDWENFMLDDLWPMFYNSKPSANPENSSIQGQFKDVVLKNKDTRALVNDAGETILIYSFPDRTHLVITTNKSTLLEIFDRLTTGRFQN